MHPVSTAIGKKVVHYMGTPVIFNIGRNQHAYLEPVDHPDTVNVSNKSVARTSAIVSMNSATGRIETQNTIYMPLSH